MREYRQLMAQQREKAVWMIAFQIIVVLAACTGGVLLGRIFFARAPESTPTAASMTPTAVRTPTPADVSLPTETPAPTDTPEPTATPTPSPTAPSMPTVEPLPIPLPDGQGDVGAYESGDPVEGAPSGVDIRTASVGADLRVTLQSAEGVPAELAESVGEGELLLWIALYDPVPDPPATFTDWVFVLDLDGDTSTGRSPGASRIDPDLGDEVAIGVSYNDISGEYEPYFLVWDRASSALVVGPEGPRFVLDETRMLIGLALPLDTLAQAAEQTAGVALVAGEIRGRAAAQSRVGEQKVIDFCPDLPE